MAHVIQGEKLFLFNGDEIEVPNQAQCAYTPATQSAGSAYILGKSVGTDELVTHVTVDCIYNTHQLLIGLLCGRIG